MADGTDSTNNDMQRTNLRKSDLREAARTCAPLCEIMTLTIFDDMKKATAKEQEAITGGIPLDSKPVPELCFTVTDYIILRSLTRTLKLIAQHGIDHESIKSDDLVELLKPRISDPNMVYAIQPLTTEFRTLIAHTALNKVRDEVYDPNKQKLQQAYIVRMVPDAFTPHEIAAFCPPNTSGRIVA